MNKKKASEEWEIKQVTIRSRDSYFELDCQYEFQVVHRKTGKVCMTFWRSEYEDDRGSRDSGTRTVKFSADGESVISIDEDGTETISLLPKKEPTP